jgi:hypothetical protein
MSHNGHIRHISQIRTNRPHHLQTIHSVWLITFKIRYDSFDSYDL